VAQIATRCPDQARHAVDDAVNDVGVESCRDMAEAQHYVLDQRVVQIVNVELAQQKLVRYAQGGAVLHKLVDLREFHAAIERVGPAEANQGDGHADPGFPVTQDSAEVQRGSAGGQVGIEAEPVAGDNRRDCQQDKRDGDRDRRFVWLARAAIRAAPQAAERSALATEGQDKGAQHVECRQASREEGDGPQGIIAVIEGQPDDRIFAIET